MSPPIPFLAEHWTLWDRACSESGRARGLGHEALVHAVPLGWGDGPSIIAAIPFAALGIPAATESAARALRHAFAIPSLSLSLSARPLGPDASRSWSSRQATAQRAASAAAFALFAQEPLAQSLALALGAGFEPESFQFFGGRAPSCNLSKPPATDTEGVFPATALPGL